MEKGESRIVNSLFKFLTNDVKEDMEIYVNESIVNEYINFESSNIVYNMFSKSISEFVDSLTADELLDLRSYTGYNFKNINAILRNNWTYDENGILTDEVKKKFLALAEKIKNILKKFKVPNFGFITYRGTTLSSFKEYGIEEISDLEYLKGKYMYEKGFTSTSILESECYYKKILDTGKNYNVEVKYLIGPECDEGALLLNQDLSYSKNQYEYLINKSALSKVVDVKVDKENNTAILTVVLLPSKIWNYQKDNEEKRQTI